MQIIFFTDDESFVNDEDTLEDDLSLIVRTTPVNGIIWSPGDFYWHAKGDHRLFAVGVKMQCRICRLLIVSAYALVEHSEPWSRASKPLRFACTCPISCTHPQKELHFNELSFHHNMPCVSQYKIAVRKIGFTVDVKNASIGDAVQLLKTRRVVEGQEEGGWINHLQSTRGCGIGT
jgi:hypothetical protein